MELGRHTEYAITRYQEAGYHMAKAARDYLGHADNYYSVMYQNMARFEYATARKLMGVEE